MIKRTILTTLLILTATSLYGQNITGQWNGILNAMGTQLKLVFHIQKADSGYTATFDSPGQGTMGIPFTSAAFDGTKLRLASTNIGAVYEGTFKADSITGTWNQGGRSFLLNLSKKPVTKKELNRPQYPKRPYPYQEEDVFIENTKDSLTLAGTLTLPDKPGPFPVVILISGSGPENRDEEVFGQKPFLVLADYLTRNGIAVLRYDDRGTAKSTGNYSTATTADFAGDALSAVEYLKTRDEIDTDNIGLIGHSEGGIIAPMVANESDDVAFLILLAATGIPGKELSLNQAIRLRSFDIQDSAAYRSFDKKLINISSSEKSISEKREEMTKMYDSVKPFLKRTLPEGTDIDAFISRTVNRSLSPWTQYFLHYNPADELEQVTVPVLSLNGSKDIQVDAAINQPAIKAALERAGNDDYKIIELKGLNHLFQKCKTCTMDEYAKIEQTFSPVALKEISAWIKEHIKKT